MTGWPGPHLDYLLFLSGVILIWAGLGWWLHSTRRLSALPKLTWALLVAMLAGGWFLVERADRVEQKAFEDRLRVMLPFCVQEFQLLGHASLPDMPSEHDPIYTELIATQIRWLNLNPFIADVYTLRRRADGALIFVVDSETDYDRDGVHSGPREQRTTAGEIYPNDIDGIARALSGETVFNNKVVKDRWGEWISAYAPLRDAAGKVEAVIGLDLDAHDWNTQRARARGVWIWSLGGIVIFFSAAMVIIALQRHELRERQRADQRLREQHELRTMIFDRAPGGVLLAEPNHQLVEVNEAFCRMVGYSRQELLRLNLAQFTHPDDRDTTLPQESGEQEKRYIRKDGSVINVIVQLNLVRDEQGAPRYIVGQVSDVTEKRRIESQLHTHQKQLSTVLANAPVVLYALDTRGIFTISEGAGLALINLKPSECVGLSIFDLYANRPDIVSDFRRSLAGETSTTQREVQGIVFECRNTPLYGTDGKITGVISIALDVTHRVQATREREKMERKLLEVQKFESLGVLAGGVAHDFNNLLTSILGNANLIRHAVPEGSTALVNLNQIEQSSQIAANLCHQLLSYAGKRRIEPCTVELSALVRDTADLLRVSVGPNARLEFALSADLPAITADPVQVRQALLNLVLNAAEALGRHEGLIEITTNLQTLSSSWLAEARVGQELPAGTYVCLEVSDNGPGLDPAAQARVFDPFFTTKGNGRGLGLAAALGIMRSHQGALHLKSAPNQGARFTLCFPVATPRIEEKPKVPATRHWRGSGTVMIVDDEEPVRAITAQMVAHYGFDVRQAASGQEAIDILRAAGKPFDLILLDLTMPVMDGYETFTAIRQLQPDQRVVVFSGYSAQDARQRFEGQNLTGFLQKPYSSESLRAILTQVSP